MKDNIGLNKVMWLFVTTNKPFLFFSSILFIGNVFYLSNPNVNNSGDFVSQSHLLIVIGMITSFLMSYFVVLSKDSQMNVNLLEEQDTTPYKSYISFLLTLILYFTILHTLIFLVLSSYYIYLFGFDMNMLFHIFTLYSNYFLLSLLIPFIVGINLALITIKVGYTYRYIVSVIITIIPVLLIFTYDFFLGKLNLTILNGKGYYSVFSGITNYTYILIIKALLLLFLIFLVFLQVRFMAKRNKMNIIILVFIITLSLSLTIKYSQAEDNDNFYTDSYIKESVKNENIEHVLSPEESNYTIKSYDIKIMDKEIPNFIVDVSIQNLDSHNIVFYLNETFKIAKIMQGNEDLSFNQEHNKVNILLKSTKDQVVTFIYKSEMGTALNPVNIDFMFLPYFFNWLPSQNNSRDYIVKENGSIEYNSPLNMCTGKKKISSNIEKLIVQYSSNNKCLSVVKGDFIKKDIGQGKEIYLPKVWAGNIGDVKEYQNYMDEALTLFNDMFHKNSLINYDTIIFIPKYDANSQPQFSDIWLQDNHQIILMDPFLNINELDLFSHLASNSIFNLSYSLMRGVTSTSSHDEIETFSLLFAIYFLEKNNLQDENLDYFLTIKSSVEVNEFLKLDIYQMEKYLISKYQSFHKGE